MSAESASKLADDPELQSSAWRMPIHRANSRSNWSANRPVVSQKSSDESTSSTISAASNTRPATGTGDSPGRNSAPRIWRRDIGRRGPEFDGARCRRPRGVDLSHMVTVSRVDRRAALLSRPGRFWRTVLRNGADPLARVPAVPYTQLTPLVLCPHASTSRSSPAGRLRGSSAASSRAGAGKFRDRR